MHLEGRQLLDKIKESVLGSIQSCGLELVDINYFYMGNRMVLRIFVDRPEGGVTIDECAELNHELGQILDSSEFLDQSYALEVSSPGLDRPLKTKDDFKRVIKKELVIFLNEQIAGRIEFRGVLKKIDEGFVYIDYDNDEVAISYERIVKAKQTIE